MSIFSSIRVPKPKRHRFNLSHDWKGTMRMGDLVPIFCKPVVPGDSFRVTTEMQMRLAPLIAPLMHRIDVFTHFFFVPNRLIWDNWEKFITGGEDGEDSPSYPRYRFDSTYVNTNAQSPFRVGQLPDYLGFPVGFNLVDNDTYTVDALPFRAYNLIYNEYYRDQNLEPEYPVLNEVDGIVDVLGSNVGLPYDFRYGSWYQPDFDRETYLKQAIRGTAPNNLMRLVCGQLCMCTRAWEKDYFTSALPWPQRGEEVELPLLGQANLSGKLSANTYSGGFSSLVKVSDGSLIHGLSGYDNSVKFDNLGYLQTVSKQEGAVGIANTAAIQQSIKIDLDDDWNKSNASVDLSGVSSATINELRRAIKAQEFLERSARGGSRYIEQILSHFGVRSSDARLQRPEYLGGGKAPLGIGEVIQTSQSTETSPQANPAGIGYTVGKTHGFKRFFEEHGYIIGLISIRPRSSYQQGMPREFSKFDRLDYFWPSFAHLGEQEVLNKELYYKGDNASSSYKPDDLFGYQSRYAEYKSSPSTVHGDFRSSLNFWHLGRIFSTPPKLNADFVKMNPINFNRVFAVEDGSVYDGVDKVWVQLYHKVSAVRPMPYYGTPMI